MKAISKNPDDRYATATDMLSALEDAMPGPLEASFDTQVADYMKSLFGNRPSERRAALRMAQEHVDRQRGESSSSISVGTLRALAIDQSSLTPSSSVPKLLIEPNGTTQASTSESQLLGPAAPRRGRLYAAAAVVAVALGAVIPLLSRGSAAEHAAAAASPVPTASLEQVVADRSVPPLPAPSAAAPVDSASGDTPSTETESGKKGARARGPRAPRAVTPSVAPSAIEVPVVKAPAAPATTGTPPAPTASTNAWDRNAFGGRH
jgi:hypothetical protein